MTILIAIIAFGVLIFVHELGHFLMCRLMGVAVLEFSIGMGPRILTKVINNTRYSLKLLPIGGSCAILGEDAAGSGDFLTAKGSETDNSDIYEFDGVRYTSQEIEEHTLINKAPWRRLLILSAGVFNNFLLAIIFSAVIVAYTGFDVPYIMDTIPSSAAASAGFEEYDILSHISLDGKKNKKIDSYRDIFIWTYINGGYMNDDSTITVDVNRNGERETLSFKPYKDPNSNSYKIGLRLFSGRIPAATPMEFVADVYHEFRYNVTVVIDSLGMLIHGKVNRQQIMGPVGAVSVIGDTVDASSKFGYFNAFLVLLELMIMLSANLGVMNLLPIPALDGGRILFVLIEMLTGKKLNRELEERIMEVTMILLLVLMFVVMGNDIVNLLTGAYKIFGG